MLGDASFLKTYGVDLPLYTGAMAKGITGILCITAAVVLAFAQHGPLKGGIMLGLAALVLVAGGLVARVTVWKRLVLGASLPPDLQKEAEAGQLVGLRGVALSPLRPSGIARFGERRVDVTAESDFLEPGTPVVVVNVAGNRVKVERTS